MSTTDVMRTTFSAREFTSDPVPDGAHAKNPRWVARFAPEPARQPAGLRGSSWCGTREPAGVRRSSPWIPRQALHRPGHRWARRRGTPSTPNHARITAHHRADVRRRLGASSPTSRRRLVLVVCVDLKVGAFGRPVSPARRVISGAVDLTPSRGTILARGRADNGLAGPSPRGARVGGAEAPGPPAAPAQVAGCRGHRRLGRPASACSTKLKRKPVGGKSPCSKRLGGSAAAVRRSLSAGPKRTPTQRAESGRGSCRRQAESGRVLAPRLIGTSLLETCNTIFKPIHHLRRAWSARSTACRGTVRAGGGRSPSWASPAAGRARGALSSCGGVRARGPASFGGRILFKGPRSPRHCG
jgi:hypothetical protein